MAVPCPKCKTDLTESAELTLTDWVEPGADPEGKARLDLILECEACGLLLNAFVALDRFEVIE